MLAIAFGFDPLHFIDRPFAVDAVGTGTAAAMAVVAVVIVTTVAATLELS